MKKYNRKLLVMMSDPHSGFSLGLTNPETELINDEGEIHHPEMNDANDYLWRDVYTWALDEAVKFAEGDPAVFLSLGDLTHGFKYIEDQKSLDASDEVFIAESNLNYAINKFGKSLVALYNALGTGSHSNGGAAEKMIMRMLYDKHPKVKIKILQHGLLDVDGYMIDFSHHGPGPGIRKWTKGNVARLYMKSNMEDELDHGCMPPNLYLRGHFHTYVRVKQIINKAVGDFESELIILPSMCLISSFAKKVIKSPSRVENGLIVKELINGKDYQTIKLTKVLDTRTKEAI